MKQQQGFTLIELIVVMVILGILAATALPKFSGLTVDARIAKMRGLAASLKSASAMAHGQSMAETSGMTTFVKLENGTTIDIQWRYPSAAASGIANAIENLNNDFSSVVGATPTGEWVFWPDAAHPNCVVRYFASSGVQPPVTGNIAVPLVDETAITGALGASNCT